LIKKERKEHFFPNQMEFEKARTRNKKENQQKKQTNKPNKNNPTTLNYHDLWVVLFFVFCFLKGFIQWRYLLIFNFLIFLIPT
jgi:hypothetical protein